MEPENAVPSLADFVVPGAETTPDALPPPPPDLPSQPSQIPSASPIAASVLSDASVVRGGPKGVTLRFLKNFLRDNEEKIDADKTTADVVREIIVPLTNASKLSYVDSGLARKLIDYDYLCEGQNSAAPVIKGDITPLRGSPEVRIKLFAFVSHAWTMPFRTLVASVEQATLSFYIGATHSGDPSKTVNTYHSTYLSSVDRLPSENWRGKVVPSDASFFWIDIFCKNQHVPSPSMDEFHEALQTSGRAVVCLWPPQRPLAFSRVWCIFEIWTALKLGLALQVSMSSGDFSTLAADHIKAYDEGAAMLPRMNTREESFQKKRSDEMHEREKGIKALNNRLLESFEEFLLESFEVDVSTAEATVPEDKHMILDLIDHSGVNAEQLNSDVIKVIVENLKGHLRMKKEPVATDCCIA